MGLKKFAVMAFVAVSPLALSGCLLLPGEFDSNLTVKKTGEFSFSYKGQIQLVGLATLLNDELNGAEAGSAEFVATCYEDGTEDKKANKAEEKKKAAKEAKLNADTEARNSVVATMNSERTSTAASSVAYEDYELSVEQSGEGGETEGVSAGDAAADAAAAAGAAAAADAVSEMEERDCTDAEIAEQKADWDESQSEAKKREAEQKKMMSALLGGIDPNDPATITRFTKEVERMAAWNKVEHLGNGLFKIDYATTGRLADDFAFPVIPRYALGQPMIHITRWDNGRVRIEAPSFHNDGDVSVMSMLGAGGIPGLGGSGKKPAEPVQVKGTFTITTDASIIANNTDEGPQDKAGMQVLSWTIGPKTYGPPMALLNKVQ